ncbi:MAG: VOC family protein [Candidatus Doudnabacteria bacterium]|nr:VOC family protein [Candidatus Doudnabacteria bacterium]
MFKAVHHLAIICSNYEKSKHFYNLVLGFRIMRETYRAERDSYKLDLEMMDGVQIELFSFPSPPSRITNPEACGLRHLALRSDTLEQTRDHLFLLGVELEPIRVDETTGKKFFFFRDPDGLPIEVYESC